ncbi:hypothetical protein SAMN04489723_1056 [Algoriphagus aquimarinus]|uniref:Uncharacterized protein n=1 Tax=Algoriphagus aquimarinus TaxID=237018 RepID=A0A1I0YQU9_9BACT|nr:hypothetical protein SAMN04489723_1056 [Algoriphagus aquimarinus]
MSMITFEVFKTSKVLIFKLLFVFTYWLRKLYGKTINHYLNLRGDFSVVPPSK